LPQRPSLRTAAIGAGVFVSSFLVALIPERFFPGWTLLPGASSRGFDLIEKVPWIDAGRDAVPPDSGSLPLTFKLPFDGDVVLSNYQVISFAIALVLMLALQYLVFRTRFGRAMRAISFDHRTAALMGIPVDRIIALTFMLGSALAAVAGLL